MGLSLDLEDGERRLGPEIFAERFSTLPRSIRSEEEQLAHAIALSIAQPDGVHQQPAGSILVVHGSPPPNTRSADFRKRRLVSVDVGLGQIAALYYRSSSLYQIH